ncbi:MAG: peptide-methionine (S)-S-oxide reductase MsrA [Casimicrobiaceae bacterium]
MTVTERSSLRGHAALRRFAGAILMAGLAGLATQAVAQGSANAPAAKPATATAVFAGGCFWCMEGPYDKLPGVISTTSGYTGGTKSMPTYEEVSSGSTGHTEAVEVKYDPAKVSYDKLLEVFWRNIDPTVENRQFCDHGSQYRSGIFVTDDAQRRAAEASKAALEKNKPFKEPILTPIVAAGKFWPAEEYHQDYYKKNPVRYKYYRAGCGRDARLKQLWGSAPE